MLCEHRFHQFFGEPEISSHSGRVECEFCRRRCALHVDSCVSKHWAGKPSLGPNLKINRLRQCDGGGNLMKCFFHVRFSSVLFLFSFHLKFFPSPSLAFIKQNRHCSTAIYFILTLNAWLQPPLEFRALIFQCIELRRRDGAFAFGWCEFRSIGACTTALIVLWISREYKFDFYLSIRTKVEEIFRHIHAEVEQCMPIWCMKLSHFCHCKWTAMSCAWRATSPHL